MSHKHEPEFKLKPQFTDEEFDEYAFAVFYSLITTENLSIEYHQKVTGVFEDALERGFGKPVFEFDVASPFYEKFQSMRRNVYIFSAAKQYSQVREMSDFIKPDVTFNDFKKKADTIFSTYNRNYLETEFNTAISQSQNARNFLEAIAEQKVFPFVTYMSQGDAKVRPEHSDLHGITLPANDPFWNTYWPPNGFNCRCFTIRKKKASLSNVDKLDIEKINAEVPDLFRANPGRTGVVFNSKKHPYFTVKRGDSQLRQKNFNLPLP